MIRSDKSGYTSVMADSDDSVVQRYLAPLPDRDGIASRLREARSRVFKSAAEAARALDMKAVLFAPMRTGRTA
jgi:hypothetical protein